MDHNYKLERIQANSILSFQSLGVCVCVCLSVCQKKSPTANLYAGTKMFYTSIRHVRILYVYILHSVFLLEFFFGGGKMFVLVFICIVDR
ncbi:hypothetical protein QBC42DRAFT_273571 [Cladorrhinum samala]|uniref:Uncharacterized protein n=1 Tax=Cladorrhinum samala TaxID=585594 RepID=A0AAV9HGU6_9PEZI|nr:hypothetical protein QBC42DRAFT_273571 [Cladorrhinum samala]